MLGGGGGDYYLISEARVLGIIYTKIQSGNIVRFLRYVGYIKIRWREGRFLALYYLVNLTFSF